jgi:radical SAM protein with 4Fe4S-binding SPASM domain
MELAARLNQQIVLPPPLEESDSAAPPPPGDAPCTTSSPGEQSAAGTKGPLRCPFVYRSVFIDTQGDVVPCCRTGLPIMGNVRQSSLAEIWNSEQYLHLRQSLKNGEPPPYCRGCHVIAQETQMERHEFHKKQPTGSRWSWMPRLNRGRVNKAA